MAKTSVQFDKQKVMVTPRGVAVYPWLTKPDTQYDEDGVYKTGMAFDGDDEGFQAFKKRVDGILKEAVSAAKEQLPAAKAKKLSIRAPFRAEEDDAGEETGRILMNAKSKAKQRMKNGDIIDVTLSIVDAKRNEIPAKTAVYGGSVLRLAVRPSAYYMASDNAVGITFYISGVQVIELQTGGSAADFFDDEDGFEAGEDDEEDVFEDADEDDEEDDPLY